MKKQKIKNTVFKEQTKNANKNEQDIVASKKVNSAEVISFFVRCMQYCFRVFIGLTLCFLYDYRQCHVVANDGS